MGEIVERFGIPEELTTAYVDWFCADNLNKPITLLDMLQEECAELIQACSKWKREDSRARAMLTEELAHVLHLSAAVAKFVGIDREEIDEEIQKKADKYGWFSQHPSVEELMAFIKRSDVTIIDWCGAAAELYNRTELSMADIHAIAGKSLGMSGDEFSDRLMKYSNFKGLDEAIHNLNAKLFDDKRDIQEKVLPYVIGDCVCCESTMNFGKVSEDDSPTKSVDFSMSHKDEKTAPTLEEIWEKVITDGLYENHRRVQQAKGINGNGDQS